MKAKDNHPASNLSVKALRQTVRVNLDELIMLRERQRTYEEDRNRWFKERVEMAGKNDELSNNNAILRLRLKDMEATYDTMQRAFRLVERIVALMEE